MSLVNTLMQPLRTQYAGGLDKNESRPSRYGAYDFFRDDSLNPNGIMDADMIAKIKRSFGNTVTVPVLDAKAVTIGSVRSCTIPDDENVSQLVTLTFATLAFGFTMYPGQYFNNDIKYQQDFSRKLNRYLIQLSSTLDQSSIDTLEAQKNVFWTGTSVYYAESGDALQVPQAEKNDFYNQLAAIMETMDFYGDIKIVQSTSGSPLNRRLVAQGDANSINENFQMLPYQWYLSNRVSNSGGVESTLYSVESGSVGFESRVDPDALAGSRIGDQKEWDVVNVPLPGSRHGLEMGSYFNKDCSDASALTSGTTGLTRTLKESFEWSADVVFVTAYNSSTATRFNPIVKAEITTA